MSARLALEAARHVAAVARVYRTDEAIDVARAAIAVANAAAGVVKFRADSGDGYNPYRDKGGKFAPGAHKARPTKGERAAVAVAKAQERVGKAKARVDAHAGKIVTAQAAKHAALAETRSALSKASAAAEMARAKPTAKNIKAAQVATNKATRAGVKVDRHEAAIGRHTEAHAKATTAHAKAVEAHAQTRAKNAPVSTPARPSPTKHEAAPDPTLAAASQPSAPVSKKSAAARQAFADDAGRRMVIGQGRTGSTRVGPDGSASRQFTADAQAAIREHHNAVLAAYDLHNHDAAMGGGRHVAVDDKMTFGGHQVYGSHGQNGDNQLWGGVADHLAKHAQQDPASLTHLGQRALAGDKEAVRMVDAYRVSTHEALHGHGVADRVLSTIGDEISTEMAARKIVGDLHGIPSEKLPGSYDRYIHPMVHAAAEATGRSFSEAWHATTEASLAMKRRSHTDDIPGRVDDHFAGDILKRLGNHDPAAHKAFANKAYQIGRDDYQHSVEGKYPSVNRYK
jgi:hypothetical protein